MEIGGAYVLHFVMGFINEVGKSGEMEARLGQILQEHQYQTHTCQTETHQIRITSADTEHCRHIINPTVSALTLRDTLPGCETGKGRCIAAGEESPPATCTNTTFNV